MPQRGHVARRSIEGDLLKVDAELVRIGLKLGRKKRAGPVRDNQTLRQRRRDLQRDAYGWIPGIRGDGHDRARRAYDPLWDYEDAGSRLERHVDQAGKLPCDPLAPMRRLDDGDDIVDADERADNLHPGNDLKARLYGSVLGAFRKAPARNDGSLFEILRDSRRFKRLPLLAPGS